MRKGGIFIIVIITIVGLIGAAVGGILLGRHFRVQQNISEAKEAMEDGDYEEAAKKLEKAVRAKGNDTDIYFMLGEAYVALDDMSKAEKVFEILLQIDNYPDVYADIADIYSDYDHYDKAYEILSEGYTQTGDDKLQKKAERAKKKSGPSNGTDTVVITDSDDTNISGADESANLNRTMIFDEFYNSVKADKKCKNYYDVTHDGYENLILVSSTDEYVYIDVYDIDEYGGIKVLYHAENSFYHTDGYIVFSVCYDEGGCYLCQVFEGIWQGAGSAEYYKFYLDSNIAGGQNGSTEAWKIVENDYYSMVNDSSNWTNEEKKTYDNYQKRLNEIKSSALLYVNTFDMDDSIWD